jgi:hypothetical protein
MFTTKDSITREIYEHEVLVSFDSDMLAHLFRRWLEESQCECSLAMAMITAANTGCMTLTPLERSEIVRMLPSGEGQ